MIELLGKTMSVYSYSHANIITCLCVYIHGSKGVWYEMTKLELNFGSCVS